jgi:hypothetical protein
MHSIISNSHLPPSSGESRRKLPIGWLPPYPPETNLPKIQFSISTKYNLVYPNDYAAVERPIVGARVYMLVPKAKTVDTLFGHFSDTIKTLVGHFWGTFGTLLGHCWDTFGTLVGLF